MVWLNAKRSFIPMNIMETMFMFPPWSNRICAAKEMYNSLNLFKAQNI